MAYLRIIVNPEDDNAFLRIVNTPRRQIGTGTLEALSRYATEREINLLEASNEVGLQTVLPKNGLDRLRKFVNWLEAARYNCHTNEPVPAIREMLSDMDYEDWLHQNASSPAVAERRWENINFLIESISKTLTRKPDNEFGEDYIEKLRLSPVNGQLS